MLVARSSRRVLRSPILSVLSGRRPDAVNEIAEAAGHIRRGVPQGDTVRGTYGDYFREEPERLQRSPAFRARVRLLDKYERLYDADVRIPCNEFFEPAVLVGVSPEMTEAHLRLFRKCADDDGGFVGHALPELDSPNAETSMVVLKPESFRNRNPLPGNLVDFFARAGMRITGMKMLELGVEKAREFYALKLPQFRRQLKGMVGKRARKIVAMARLLAEQAVSHLGADAAVALRPANAPAAAPPATAISSRPVRCGVASQVRSRRSLVGPASRFGFLGVVPAEF